MLPAARRGRRERPSWYTHIRAQKSPLAALRNCSGGHGRVRTGRRSATLAAATAAVWGSSSVTRSRDGGRAIGCTHLPSSVVVRQGAGLSVRRPVETHRVSHGASACHPRARELPVASSRPRPAPRASPTGSRVDALEKAPWAKPQSVPAITFSRPTSFASRTSRWATSSGCSTTFVWWVTTPGNEHLALGQLDVLPEPPLVLVARVGLLDQVVARRAPGA